MSFQSKCIAEECSSDELIKIYMSHFKKIFIVSGINDIIDAINLAIDIANDEGTFSWARWFAKKTVEYGSAVIGYVSKQLTTHLKWDKVRKFLRISEIPTSQTPTALIKSVCLKTFESEAIGKQLN